MHWSFVPLIALATLGQESAPSAMEKLQAVQELVGSWHGSGTSDRVKTWEEQLDCQWTFGPDDEASLELAVGSESEGSGEKKPDGRLFESATLTYDEKGGVYRLRLIPLAVADRKPSKGGSSATGPIWFAGGAKTPRNLVLDRVERGTAKDVLDRMDIKVLNDGDRLVYSFHRRVGKSKSYKSIAQIALDRRGTSLAGSGNAAAGPKCIVTGGIGSMAVTVKEGTFYVCCTGCRDAFLADPAKFLARAATAKEESTKP